MPGKFSCNPTNLLAGQSAVDCPLILLPTSYRPYKLFFPLETDFPNSIRANANLIPPLATIYRIYVAILGGHHRTLRNEVEYVWNQHQWRVCDIPEPPPPVASDIEQRAVLATIPYLLVKAFNRLINLGLPRDAPAIIHDELMAELKSRPKVFDKVPRWAESVQPAG